jgi:pimeloyl-ACP methyl ester carboxylesterase
LSTVPVVLVHGFATSSARTWGDNGWLDLLADIGRTAIPMDLLGHGSAHKPAEPEAYDSLETELYGRFPEGTVDAIGFSLGARTLLVLAAQHPDRFRSLIIAGVGQNLFPSNQSTGLGEAIAAAIEGSQVPDDPTLRYFATLAEAPDQDPAALAALMRRTNAPAVTTESLAAITCPVLVVLGDKDFAGPADPLVTALANVQLVTLRNVDHFATPKDFGFIGAALDFLAELP